MSEARNSEAHAHPTRRWSLSNRLTWSFIGVALITLLASSLISLNFVRGTVEDAARREVQQQAAVLAAAADEGGDVEDAAVALVSASGNQVAIIAPDGTVTGEAARWAVPRVVQRLLSGDDVSGTTARLRDPVILQGEPTADGGGIVVVRSDVALQATTRELMLRLLPGVLIGVALAIGASFALVRLTARPLVATAAAARRMAAGERSVPVPETSVAEVHDVADALAALDGALTTSEGRQREFLLSISHELRTPLTALRGYAEGLADGVIPAADVPRVGAILATETERLTAFVTDLLALARLEADDFSIDAERVDLADLLAATATTWTARADQLDVRIRVEAAPVAVHTDARRLRQLLDGLVENALRVSPAGSQLVLAVRTSANFTVVDVTDEGPGLTDDDLARAFDRGLLRERYRESRPVGTGLGLSIAQRLAGRLGATLSAARGDGGGTTFSLILPR